MYISVTEKQVDVGGSFKNYAKDRIPLDGENIS